MLEDYEAGDGRKWRGIFISKDKLDKKQSLTGIGRGVSYTNWIYEGQVINEKANGYGRTIFNYGDYYIGHFKDNYFEGEGIWYKKDGSIKEKGVWKNGIC